MKTSLTVIALAVAASLGLSACGDDERSRSDRTATARSGGDSVQNQGNTPGGTSTGQPGGSNVTGSAARGTPSDTRSSTTSSGTSGSTMAGGTASNPSPGSPAGGVAAGTQPSTGPVTSSGAAGGTGQTVGSGATPGTASTGTPLSGARADATKSAIGTTEKRFITAAASSGMMEVEAGKVVQQQAATPAVRQLAERLVKDHEASNAELKQLASSKSLPLPDQLAPQDRATVDKLRKLQGKELDRMYLEQVGREHHRKDIAEFERAARESNDPDVRAFAQKTLPVLREHHQQAQQVAQAAVSAGGASK